MKKCNVLCDLCKAEISEGISFYVDNNSDKLISSDKLLKGEGSSDFDLCTECMQTIENANIYWRRSLNK